MEDKRRLRRRGAVKAGLIAFGEKTLSCTVRNLNGSGAILTVASEVAVPKEFTLAFSPGAVRRECRIVWIKEKRIGVAFHSDRESREEQPVLHPMINAGN